jgi:Dolichyl-phosphate-mannose-protein mannosyltransferase
MPRPATTTERRRNAVALWLPVALIVVGTLIRLVQLLSGRSLWLDESFLWLNLDRRSLTELMGPLDFAQGAPIPFLVTQKLAIGAFGDAEWALRLAPFLAGVAAIGLAWVVARRYVTAAAVPIVVALVALSPPSIYFAAEAKQYSFDLVAALAAYLLAFALISPRRPSRVRMAGVAVAGAALVWFSDPSVFMLAGIGLVVIADAWRRRDGARLRAMLAVGSVWLVSFAAVWVVHVGDLTNVRRLATGADGGSSAREVTDLIDNLRAMARLFEDSLGMPSVAVALAIVVALAGAISMRDRGATPALAVLVAPLGVMLCAGVAGAYPIGDRFVLFTAPCLALLVAQGIVAVWSAVGARGRPIAVAVAAGVMLGPVASAASILISPVERQEVGTVVRYVAEHRRPGDRIYVYHAGQYAFAYYAPRNGIAVRAFIPSAPDAEVPPERYWGAAHEPALASTPEVLIGRWSDNLPQQLRDVDRIVGPGRVWLVFSTVRRTLEVNDQTLMIQRLRSRGDVIDEISAEGAAAVLMQLR